MINRYCAFLSVFKKITGNLRLLSPCKRDDYMMLTDVGKYTLNGDCELKGLCPSPSLLILYHMVGQFDYSTEA